MELDCVEIKTQNARLYSMKHKKNYRNEKECASRCGQGSPYNHRGKLKAAKQRETTALKLVNKVQIQKGHINHSGEMNYACNHIYRLLGHKK